MDDKQKAFMKEYGELVEKHKMDFANYPMYIPDGEGGFKTVMQSVPVPIQEGVKSPFVAEA